MTEAVWIRRAIGLAIVMGLGACTSGAQQEEPVSVQEWDLHHGFVDQDGCPFWSNRIVGTEGDDVLTGTRRADCILGLGGNDQIHGLGGDDVILGGDGDDQIWGDGGTDKLLGGEGNDVIYGGDGRDVLLGGGGNDILDGGSGSDWVSGGACNDHLKNGNGFDVLLGGDGNDRIDSWRRHRHDVIDGGDGVDVCRGHRCELPNSTPSCSDDSDCGPSQHCDAVSGVCSDGAGGDATCDGVDDDCDGRIDEDFVPGSCEDGAVLDCVDGEVVATQCDDGDACNGVETCEAGACVAGSALPVDDGNPCTADACDPSAGVTHTALPAGTSCGDGDACNGDETCDGAGSCVAGMPPVLYDGNPCTDDACDPVAGVTHTPTAAGTGCSDGDVCNGDETCDGAGSCVAGTPLSLDDGNDCTADACDSATGVSHNPVAAGSACGVDGTCDGAGNCQLGPCVGQPAGTSCSDGDICNGEELCDGNGTCLAGTPPDRLPTTCR